MDFIDEINGRDLDKMQQSDKVLCFVFLTAAFIILGLFIHNGRRTYITDKVSKMYEDKAEASRVIEGILGGSTYWTVTQYGNDEWQQQMFYSIESSDGELVLIDGGYKENAPAIRELIKKHGKHVEAWIITHPHEDHVSAFNEIMSHPEEQDIKIDVIYTVEVNDERYRQTAHDYDRIEFYDSFKALTEKMDNVIYLKEGDSLSLSGLNMQVIHSWDEHVDAEEATLCNDGSLMFKLSAAHNSMLFCADVQAAMEPFITEKHAELIKSDYVQCGHHGNWGLTADFYDTVGARIAFMDAPSSIIDYEEGRFDGYKLRNHFLEKGVEIKRFTTAPNSVILY